MTIPEHCYENGSTISLKDKKFSQNSLKIIKRDPKIDLMEIKTSKKFEKKYCSKLQEVSCLSVNQIKKMSQRSVVGVNGFSGDQNQKTFNVARLERSSNGRVYGATIRLLVDERNTRYFQIFPIILQSGFSGGIVSEFNNGEPLGTVYRADIDSVNIIPMEDICSFVKADSKDFDSKTKLPLYRGKLDPTRFHPMAEYKYNLEYDKHGKLLSPTAPTGDRDTGDRDTNNLEVLDISGLPCRKNIKIELSKMLVDFMYHFTPGTPDFNNKNKILVGFRCDKNSPWVNIENYSNYAHAAKRESYLINQSDHSSLNKASCKNINELEEYNPKTNKGHKVYLDKNGKLPEFFTNKLFDRLDKKWKAHHTSYSEFTLKDKDKFYRTSKSKRLKQIFSINKKQLTLILSTGRELNKVEELKLNYKVNKNRTISLERKSREGKLIKYQCKNNHLMMLRCASEDGREGLTISSSGGSSPELNIRYVKSKSKDNKHVIYYNSLSKIKSNE